MLYKRTKRRPSNCLLMRNGTKRSRVIGSAEFMCGFNYVHSLEIHVLHSMNEEEISLYILYLLFYFLYRMWWLQCVKHSPTVKKHLIYFYFLYIELNTSSGFIICYVFIIVYYIYYCCLSVLYIYFYTYYLFYLPIISWRFYFLYIVIVHDLKHM